MNENICIPYFIILLLLWHSNIIRKTHHFTVDFVEMYFADFIYYVFRMESHETETCKKS